MRSGTNERTFGRFARTVGGPIRSSAQALDHSIVGLVGQSICPSVGWSVGRSVIRISRASAPTHRPISDRPTNRSTDGPKRIDQPIERWNDRFPEWASICSLVERLVARSVIRIGRASDPSHRPISDRPTNRSTDEPKWIDQPVERWSDRAPD